MCFSLALSVLQFQANPLPPAMLFSEGLACSTKEYPVHKLARAPLKSKPKFVPEALRGLGSHVCGQIDWKLHCLKPFVAQGAKIAEGYGITCTEFMRHHPRGQIPKGHWQEFCGWRNGGLSGDVNCASCMRLSEDWAPPLQVGNALPLPDANAPPLQYAGAPPLQDAHAPPLEDGPTPTTPRKTASKHALSNPPSPGAARANRKIPKLSESLVCDDVKLWLDANRPGLYEWVLGHRKNAAPRVNCLVCLEYLQRQGGKKNPKLAQHTCGFEVSHTNLSGIKQHETRTATHKRALESNRIFQSSQGVSVSQSSNQLVPSAGSSSSHQWVNRQSQSRDEVVLMFGSKEDDVDDEETLCVGVDLALTQTRAGEVHYISPPPNIFPQLSTPSAFHHSSIPTYSNISQQSIPAVAMKVCSLTRRPTNM